MNCKEWEERIALSAAGDLGPEQAAEVERHLAECGECRGFAQGMEDSLALLRSAHEEPIAAGHFTAVRAAVLARLAQRRPWRRWAWVTALAAGLAVAGVFVAERPAERPRVYVAQVRPPDRSGNHSLTVVAPNGAASVSERSLGSTGSRRNHARPRRTVAPPPALVEPVVVKLITDDPDVVIYWIADGKGDRQ